MINDRILFNRIILIGLLIGLTSFHKPKQIDSNIQYVIRDVGEKEKDCKEVECNSNSLFNMKDNKFIIPYIECKQFKLTNMNEVLNVALSQWNFKEIQGSRNHNPQIVKYFKEIGYKINNDETPWCSAFLNWCAMKAGYEYTTKLNARSWSKIGTEIEKPNWKIGDVVTLWRESKSSWKGHVGLYIRHDNEYIYLLGGNQSNKVTISAYRINRVLTVTRLNKLNHENNINELMVSA